MTEETLTWNELSIRQAPGFSTDGFQVEDLSEGVNIIHGPNGAGKSTLAESILALQWPQTAPNRSSIIGQFSIDEDDWRIDLVSNRAEYQQNGSPSNGPTLPSPEQRHSYHLSLHDLLQHETKNQSFAQQINQESIGGYDLDTAYEALGYDDSASTRGINEYTEAQRAREVWQTAKQEAEELQAAEARLPQLKARRDEAAEASQLVELYEQTIDYQEAKNELSEAQAEFETFPEVLSEINGTEAEQVASLRERVKTTREKIESAQETLDTAREARADAELPEDGVPDGLIAGLEERRDSLESLSQTRIQLKGELEDARTRREAAREDLPADTDPELLKELEPAAWEDISEFAEAAEHLRARRATYTAVTDWLSSSTEPSRDLESLRRGKQALEEWLSAGTGDAEQDGRAAFRIGVISSVLLSAAGIALGLLVHPFFYGTVLFAALLFWYGYHQSRRADTGSSDRDIHRETYENLELDGPESWTASAVRNRLNELYSMIAGAHLEQKRAERKAAITPDLETLENDEAELAAKRETLIDRYGVAPVMSDIELLVFTKDLLRWQSCHEEVLGRKAELEEIVASMETERDSLATELAAYGYERVPDYATATQHIRALRERQQQYAEATATIQRTTDTIEDADSQIDELTTERASIYEALDLEDEDYDELTALCDQVEAYREAKNTVERKREVCNRERDELESYEHFTPDLLEQSLPELREARDSNAETAAAYDELNEEITEIRTRIKDAKQEYDLEEAVESRQRALVALESRLESDVTALVGDALVEHLRDTTEDSSRPDVFDRAREILATITRGRYELDITGEQFRATDTVKQRSFALTELSSGTKLQVLLAVRIAFVEHQEQGVRLPLLLDETLANSDDQRATIIIESMLELVRNGRQLFYFTAQGDEVARWRQCLDSTEDIPSREIDLTANRDDETALDIPEYETLAAAPKDLPDPAAHDHQSYGDAIEVPPFTPRRGAGSAHVWYVVTDVELLDHLLRIGVETWGQLEMLLDLSDRTLLTDDPESRADIQLNGAALREYVAAWEVGRGKQVDRQTLEKTSAVTAAFIEDVSDLTNSVNGDAEQLIAELHDGAVKGFRTGKMNELEQYFEEAGFIQQRDPLDASTIRVRIISRLMDYDLSREDALLHSRALFKRLSAKAETNSLL